jgi:hypothetical protein
MQYCTTPPNRSNFFNINRCVVRIKKFCDARLVFFRHPSYVMGWIANQNILISVYYFPLSKLQIVLNSTVKKFYDFSIPSRYVTHLPNPPWPGKSITFFYSVVGYLAWLCYTYNVASFVYSMLMI